MHKVQRPLGTTLATILAIAVLAGCSSAPAPAPAPSQQGQPAPTQQGQPAPTQQGQPAPAPPDTTTKPGTAGDGPAVTVTAKPADIAVLVNKQIMLPDGYKPPDLVEPNVAFIFTEKAEKRLMRKEAAQALEQMFAGAKKDGIFLAGVSGYRSYETQVSLFKYYVQTQGEAMARKYSAEAGHSEHQTGLAMDVSGSTGKCAADDCFADTPEAKWLATHAPAYGFIIRYPKGKEAITGYAYEPWHVRFLGLSLAQKVAASGLTLEEYLGAAH
jgi:D-alanyl-D-alanine carboxypeptidase